MEYQIDAIKSWEKQFGDPLYVFDEKAFIENYKHYDQCFKSIYPQYRISYSYKTNYALYICRLVKQLGGFAEVVSDMELQIAKRVGYHSEEIVYNGPSKGVLAFDHIQNGGILNIDNFEELSGICQYANNNAEKQFKIGVRVNIDIGQNFISRFGIDEEEMNRFFDSVKSVPNVSVVGVHCHIGRSRTLEAWKNRVTKILGIIDKFFVEQPEYVSLGSGMFGIMNLELAEQFSKDIPSFEDYAEVVAKPFVDRYGKCGGPILFTEPGTTLINKYIDFVAKVESIKHIKGKTFIVLNSSKHNLGEICELKKLPITVLSNSTQKETVTNADYVGYTCLEHDVLYREYDGEIGPGDYVIFENVGGYSNVSKPPFIRPNCAMISSLGNLIKRRETYEEIIETYE